MLVQYFIL